MQVLFHRIVDVNSGVVVMCVEREEQQSELLVGISASKVFRNLVGEMHVKVLDVFSALWSEYVRDVAP